MTKKFTRPRVTDSEVQRAFDQLCAELDNRATLNQFPPVGKVFEDVLLDTTQVQLAHGLGYVPKHWIVTDRDGTATIYRSKRSTSSHIYLTASASVVANIWVF